MDLRGHFNSAGLASRSKLMMRYCTSCVRRYRALAHAPVPSSRAVQDTPSIACFAKLLMMACSLALSISRRSSSSAPAAGSSPKPQFDVKLEPTVKLPDGPAVVGKDGSRSDTYVFSFHNVDSLSMLHPISNGIPSCNQALIDIAQR